MLKNKENKKSKKIKKHKKSNSSPGSFLPAPQFRVVERDIEFADFSLPCGCEERLVEVAGTCVRIRSGSPEILSFIDRRYGNFRSKRKPFFCVEAAACPGIGSRESTTIFAKTKGERLFIECGFIRGVIDGRKRTGKVRVRKGQETNVDVFLRNCFAFFLAERNGVLVHAAALVKGNCAFLFPGRSGAGKTTLSKSNRRNMLVLSDETCAVRRVKGTLRVFGTPFWGSMHPGPEKNNKSIKMDSILFPRKGRGNCLSELQGAEALGRLMGCVIHITKNRKRTAGVFSLCHEIAMQGRCYELCLEKGTKLEGLLWQGR